jgi:hypothetical protein
MNNAFVNGFAASVSAPAFGFASAGADRRLVERPRTAAAMAFSAVAPLAAAHHAAAAQATAIRPAIPVHT